MNIRIGTRGSKLALYQAKLVAAEIQKLSPRYICEIIPIVTTGDEVKDKTLYDIGGKALFLKEIEERLIARDINIGVHSLKDVPGILPKQLIIAAVLPREDPRDALISFKAKTLLELPAGSKVGTSSVRRKIIIKRMRPDIEILPLRGNVPTRLNKVKSGEVDATILAYAGIKRLGLYDPSYCHIISPSEMLPAAGQGTIGIEIRKNDFEMLQLCNKINHLPSWHVTLAERSFLTYLDASCRTPLGAYATIENQLLTADYMISDFEGSFIKFITESGDIDKAQELGIRAGKKLYSFLKQS